MKHEKAPKSFELSHLIVKEKENVSDSEDIEVYGGYSVFIKNKEETLNEKRQWAVKIILLALISSFSLGIYYFENIFHSGIYGAYMLINSLIPIIFIFIIEKYGIRFSPIYITGTIFLGHCLCIVGIFLHMKYFTLLGLFISNFCINPLVMLQEILIIEIFQQDKLGFLISIILSIQKLIEFIFSFLKNNFDKNLIQNKIFFVTSLMLSLFSFFLSLIYNKAINKNKKVLYVFINKKGVFKNIETMSVYFWWYLLVCFSCSCIWNPFVSFLTKIKHTYFLENIITADFSSRILLLSFLLYPIIGWVNDHYGHRLIILMISLFMSLLSFMSLLLPIKSNIVFITLFSLGQGVSSIILIILTLYISKNVLIAFGFYKTIEISGNTIMDSLVNIVLNLKKKRTLNNTDINLIVMLFTTLNMFSLVFLASFYRHDSLYNKRYINNCLFTLFNKKSKIIYQDIIFRSKEISLKLTKIFLGLIVTGLILTWILYIITISQ
ncbi:uncharacterized protein T551_01496 [Pneumocystis jirovecii RU7]|uniref:Major facilitator superfamily (MFS) profile domain-containing protein n=1 Tax=Pneumocystis jirovecii (strain RU7) TaxID=1408657 RepID=A0A0W4ZRH7_PNEJ7|nr:uncharacterized protein T551_01496 [Pneumocystis jirovecii RU7]KTW30944.1 hypothetical protein T551_01496 [Pneumocystis jirovecii RU7]